MKENRYIRKGSLSDIARTAGVRRSDFSVPWRLPLDSCVQYIPDHGPERLEKANYRMGVRHEGCGLIMTPFKYPEPAS